MSFGGGGSGSSQIATAQDVALSNPATGQVLTYDGALGKWKNAAATGGAVSSVAGRTGAVVLTASDVGLANVDNTSDASKPVSSATQTALNTKISSSLVNAANGVAGLDASVLLPVALLPAGSTLTVQKSGGTWPARPTSRSDITVQWKGADPSPTIVASGTGGMLDNVDVRFVTP
jgi:hypothetical protein